MPRRAGRACATPGCPRVVFGRGLCDVHKRARWREYEERRPDRTETKRFYASAAWQKARRAALEASGGACVVCGRPAVHVDHVLPVKDGGDPLALENLAALCLADHSAKTARENRAKGRW